MDGRGCCCCLWGGVCEREAEGRRVICATRAAPKIDSLRLSEGLIGFLLLSQLEEEEEGGTQNTLQQQHPAKQQAFLSNIHA